MFKYSEWRSIKDNNENAKKEGRYLFTFKMRSLFFDEYNQLISYCVKHGSKLFASNQVKIEISRKKYSVYL